MINWYNVKCQIFLKLRKNNVTTNENMISRDIDVSKKRSLSLKPLKPTYFGDLKKLVTAVTCSETFLSSFISALIVFSDTGKKIVFRIMPIPN